MRQDLGFGSAAASRRQPVLPPYPQGPHSSGGHLPPPGFLGTPQPGNQQTGGQRPPLMRDRQVGWIAGVAAGIAQHLNWPVWLVRVCFLGLTMASFVGLAVYGGLWILMPTPAPQPQAPGLTAATHANMRSRPLRQRPTPAALFTACLMVAVGLVMLVQNVGLGVKSVWFWPLVLSAAGVTLVWRQTDLPRTSSSNNLPRWLSPLVTSRGWGGAVRVAIGLAMVGCALVLVMLARIGLSQLPTVLAVAAMVLAGVLVLAAPWLHSYQRQLDQAYHEKLAAEMRADMAAHLHDSVLQTLALIQRQASDPKAVATLARRQERELRTWLYGDMPTAATLKTALSEVGAEVENETGVAVEVVCVGDIALNSALEALVRAAREAMMNAAKHSQCDLVDVFAEVEQLDDGGHQVQVFVRDRGVGFDTGKIAEDRQGVRGSIIGRMERHGGHAAIRSAPGAGTEVRLEMRVNE